MSKFSLDVKKFAAKAEKAADDAISKICLDLLSDIVLNTPVDSGRARANWQCSIGAPASGQVQFEGDTGSGIRAPRESAASARAIAAGSVAVASAPRNIFWISNNLPYIYRLEFEQWSKQAPSGMVRLAINRAERKMR
jgi:hypothetical protein